MKTHRKAKKKTIKVRKKLISKPAVKGFKDFNSPGLIRVLDRDKDKFPEFALYPRARNAGKVVKSLRDAGLKQEEKGKWVLRTDRFNIFVYV
jgi:hypothetical protein